MQKCFSIIWCFNHFILTLPYYYKTKNLLKMNIKTRLAVMNFLEFAVWGAYLTSMGNYLGKAGMGAEIAWFYAIQGIVSIFMPTIVGIIADKYVQPQRMLGICHQA